MWIILEHSVAFLATSRQVILVIFTISRKEREKQTNVSKVKTMRGKFRSMVVGPLLRIMKGYLKQ